MLSTLHSAMWPVAVTGWLLSALSVLRFVCCRDRQGQENVSYLLQGDMVCDGLQLWRGSLDLFVGVNFCNLFPLSHSIKSVGSIANLENSVASIV